MPVPRQDIAVLLADTSKGVTQLIVQVLLGEVLVQHTEEVCKLHPLVLLLPVVPEGVADVEDSEEGGEVGAGGIEAATGAAKALWRRANYNSRQPFSSHSFLCWFYSHKVWGDIFLEVEATSAAAVGVCRTAGAGAGTGALKWKMIIKIRMVILNFTVIFGIICH